MTECSSTDLQQPTTSKGAVSTSQDEMAHTVSFTSIISTPPKKVKKDEIWVARRKSINYRATVIEKSLFSIDQVPNPKKKKENPNDQKKNHQPWHRRKMSQVNGIARAVESVQYKIRGAAEIVRHGIMKTAWDWPRLTMNSFLLTVRFLIRPLLSKRTFVRIQL